MRSITQTYLIYLFIPIALLLTGCGDDDKNVIAQPTYEEQHFAADTSLRAKYPDSIKINLEPKNGEAHKDDLHEIGSDCYRYQFEKPIIVKLSMSDDTKVSQKTLTHSDSGQVLATASPGTDSVAYELAPNVDYTLCLESHEDNKAMQTIMVEFIAHQTKDARKICQAYDPVSGCFEVGKPSIYADSCPEYDPATGCPKGCFYDPTYDKSKCLTHAAEKNYIRSTTFHF